MCVSGPFVKVCYFLFFFLKSKPILHVIIFFVLDKRVAAFDRPGVPLTSIATAGRGGAVVVGDAHGGVSLLAVMTPP